MKGTQANLSKPGFLTCKVMTGSLGRDQQSLQREGKCALTLRLGLPRDAEETCVLS